MNRSQMQQIRDSLPPHSRKRVGIEHLIELETRGVVIELVTLNQLEHDIGAEVVARLRAEMDTSDGLTPEMMMAEFPAFAAVTKGGM